MPILLLGEQQQGAEGKLTSCFMSETTQEANLPPAHNEPCSSKSLQSPRVPFHLPNIPRPQEEYSISVDNSNEPFQHTSLEKTLDGSRYIHPLEQYSASDFVDRHIEPTYPPPLHLTQFFLVDNFDGLMELKQVLQGEKEFAVDLEQNYYRSFQGFTCLMQISTRTKDFVIDVFKLHKFIHLLSYIFMDPHKTKVMHGANNDIICLQRDFSIYACNLFDTAQASRILCLGGNSLSHLLSHYCGVTADKQYQTADWRQRPLPCEMIRYAREDTHYLLYIYDMMRANLQAMSGEDDLLLQAYNRSYDICNQFYHKPLLTYTSYLHIRGLKDANLDSRQLAATAALHWWRDGVAREADESMGY